MGSKKSRKKKKATKIKITAKQRKTVMLTVKQQKAVIFAVSIMLVATAAVLLFRPAFKYIFPLDYGVEVQSSAAEYGLDPWLVYAVIKTESDFTPDAISRAGAQGLMQIMPDTADWIAWRQGREHDEDKIFNPGYNVDMGCYLLSYLLDYYAGNIDFALAAYNAGKSAVDGWLKDPECYDGKELSIPYNETRSYVAKVKYAYEQYKNLYE